MEPAPSGSVDLTASLPLGTPLGVVLQHPHAVERDTGHRAGVQGCPARGRAVAEPHAVMEPDFSRRLRIFALCVQVFQKLLRMGVIVRTGDIFGSPTHIRVTTGTDEQNARFIESLKKVLA